MSSALALAGVTAVLKNMLIDAHLSDVVGVDVTVSALPPDAVQLGNDAAPRLNLFLHQVTHNAAWRNAGQPARDAAGERLSNAPLALDLHYLLTAYASAELQAEALLGSAMLLLHETPMLSRGIIRKVLNPPPPPPNGGLLPAIHKALRTSGLADQIEQIKVTPEVMNTEELSKLWSAFQAHYRPTAAYQATVVLIDPSKPARSPLPVLKRGPLDPVTKRELGAAVQVGLQSSFPEIVSIVYPKAQIAALLGDTVTINGHGLDGSSHALLLSNVRLGIDLKITPASSADAASVHFIIPNQPDEFPAGVYTATLQIQRTGESSPRAINQLALSIAPQLTALPATADLDAKGDLTLMPTCKPNLRPNQRVSLILDGIEAPAAPFTASTSTPSFTFRKLPPGDYRARLRVEGVDSPFVDRTKSPPIFEGPQIEVRP